MSSDRTSRLAAPFASSAVGWHAVGRGEDGSRVRLAPHLRSEAVQERLDRVVGTDGWSLRLAAWGPDGLLAELTVLGTTRAGAARLAPPVRDAALASDAALSAAAARFGLVVPLVLVDDGWVDADPGTGEPLHLPETAERASVGTRPIAEVDAGRGAAPVDAGAVRAGAPADGRGPDAAPAAGTEDGPPEAQRVIDRLVERLREEGLGAEAAKLVTRYGGYGGDAARSRELYARLRELLIRRGGS